MAIERIPLLVTPSQKALYARKAKASNLTLLEFVRRAADAYNPRDHDEILLRLVVEVKRTTLAAKAVLTAAISTCAKSNRRIAKMEAAHVGRHL
jgi:hypothetical protein